MMTSKELDKYRTPETGGVSADCLQRVVGRRVVTISVAGVANNASTQCNWITTAVCDDGSMWWLRDNDAEWRELPTIPQPPNNGGQS